MSDDSFDEFEAEALRAEEELGRGRHRDAFERFLALLIGRTVARFAAGQAVLRGDLQAIERLASLATLFGEHQAAEDLFGSYANFARGAGNDYAADYALLAQAQVALARGALREAERSLLLIGRWVHEIDDAELSLAGLERWEASVTRLDSSPNERPVLFTQIYLVRGRLLAANGQYRASVIMLERGLELAQNSSVEVVRSARLLLQLAHAAALLEMGALSEADIALNEAKNELNPTLAPGAHVEWLELRGKLELLRGRFGAALERFSEVASYCTNGAFVRARLIAMMNLAHIEILLNHTRDATTRLIDVEQRAQALGDDVMRSRAQFLRAVAARRSSSLANAVSVAPSVSAMWGMTSVQGRPDAPVSDASPLDLPQSPNFLTLFEDRALGFHWYLSMQDTEGAASVVNWMEGVFSSADSPLMQVRLTVMRGLLEYYLKAYADAERQLAAALPALEELELKPELWQATRVLGWCYSRLGRPAEQRQALMISGDRLLQQLTESLHGADQATFLLNKWAHEEEYLAGEVDALAAAKKRWQAAAWYRRPLLRYALMRRLHRFVAYLARSRDTVLHAQTGADQRPPRPGGCSDHFLMSLLKHPRSRATVSFVVLPNQVVIVHRGFLGIDFGVTPIGRIQLRDTVRLWHELMYRRRRSPARHIAVAAREREVEKFQHAKKRIVDMLAEHLQLAGLLDNLPTRVKAITLEPDDSLHGFPFCALEINGQYLVERFALTIGTEIAQAPLVQRRAPAIKNALMVGVSQGTTSFETIPGVQTELERVGGFLKNRAVACRELNNATATRAAVLQALPHAQLVHVACHGTFKPDRPQESGLVLVADPQHPELLSFTDLQGLDLSRIEHLTLSSCWSADNFVMPGRWIRSLPQTLRAAGVGSVLGCLWPVDDSTAVDFMSRFYWHLNVSSREEALRRTQLECIARQRTSQRADAASEVFFWAGFSLYGTPARLSLG